MVQMNAPNHKDIDHQSAPKTTHDLKGVVSTSVFSQLSFFLAPKNVLGECVYVCVAERVHFYALMA